MPPLPMLAPTINSIRLLYNGSRAQVVITKPYEKLPLYVSVKPWHWVAVTQCDKKVSSACQFQLRLCVYMCVDCCVHQVL